MAVSGVGLQPRRLWRGAAAWSRLGLRVQFMVFSGAVLVAGAALIGAVVATAVKQAVLNRTMGVTALYVDSFIAPHLQEMADQGTLSPIHFDHLDSLLGATPLGTKIVSFKVWSADGTVVYATDRSLVGRRFEPGPGLKAAAGGGVHSTLSRLGGEENRLERARWPRLVETYAPVRKLSSNAVIGVAEFYQLPDELEAEVAQAQRLGWLVVVVATLVMYALLNRMVGVASATIGAQTGQLRELGDRLRRAAAQKSETDEQLLRRVARDLHDGPAQDISLALLRLEGVERVLASDRKLEDPGRPDLQLIQTALASALSDLRAISAGLQLPELNGLTPGAVAARAVELHQAKTRSRVMLTVSDATPSTVPAAVSIALFRVIQESLNNSSRHGGVKEHWVNVHGTPDELVVEVVDRGAGFSPDAASPRPDALGLQGMSERVALLGGHLSVDSTPGQGTLVRALLPLEGA